MGDPKFSRKKYVTPSHPWQGERIARESEIVRKYGLKNKTELWKVESLLRVFRQRARDLQAKVRSGNIQAEKEREQLLERLGRMGLLGEESDLNDVLTLDLENLLARRLQSMAYLKGLSNSSKQARQFIVHGHIGIDGRKVTIPGYFVKRGEEEAIDYFTSSPLAHDLHPARPRDETEPGPEPLPATEPEQEAPAKEPSDAPKGDEAPKKEDKTAEPAETPKADPKAEKEKVEKPPAEKPKDEKLAPPPAEKKEEPPEQPPAEEKKEKPKGEKPAPPPAEKKEESPEQPPVEEKKEKPGAADKGKEAQEEKKAAADEKVAKPPKKSEPKPEDPKNDAKEEK